MDATTDGQIAVSMSGNRVLDLASNGNTAASTYSVVYNGVAPAIPENIAATPGDQQVSLSWDASAESDFAQYVIYHHDEEFETVDVNIQAVQNVSGCNKYYDTPETETGRPQNRIHSISVSYSSSLSLIHI